MRVHVPQVGFIHRVQQLNVRQPKLIVSETLPLYFAILQERSTRLGDHKLHSFGDGHSEVPLPWRLDVYVQLRREKESSQENAEFNELLSVEDFGHFYVIALVEISFSDNRVKHMAL